MHAAKNTWQLVVDLSCFPDVLVVSSCGSETTTFDQKSSVVDFRVMSTSFWFSGVPCVACFVVCPHFVFNFGVACRVVHVWVRIRLRQCVRCVFIRSLASVTRKLLCRRRRARLFNMVAHCVEGLFSV